MKYVNYVEFENVNYFVGDFVIFNKPGLPEISGTIDSIGSEYSPIISVSLDNNGGLCILKWSELEKIRKTSIEEDFDETMVNVEHSGDWDGLRECYECKGCGCTEIFDSFTYCPNCGKEIIWP